MARGLGLCMGFDIMINFNLPYFATNPRDFWQRWHISLSTWLRDYLYIPMGGSRKGSFVTYRNLVITMLLGGLWHGAKWTFVIWGAYHGALLIIHRLLQPLLEKIPLPKGTYLSRLWLFARIVFFFNLVCVGWLIFRTQSITQLYYMLQSLTFNFHLINGKILRMFFYGIPFYVITLVFIETAQFMKNDLLVVLKSTCSIRILVYLVFFYSIVVFGVNRAQNFIYFQF
jgi:D-alanyl-lipoteichoic acid acyltransferase DltB (MBOAT superfamily)